MNERDYEIEEFGDFGCVYTFRDRPECDIFTLEESVNEHYSSAKYPTRDVELHNLIKSLYK